MALSHTRPHHASSQAGDPLLELMLRAKEYEKERAEKVLRELQHVAKSPRTRAQRERWWNWFMIYYQNMLDKDPSETPTADDIAKFCILIVNHVKPVKNSVPSFTWLESALETTRRSWEFHYKSFTYDYHDKARVQAVLNTLLLEGKVTCDPTFERKWAGCVVVRILVTGHITDAWMNGTISWDNTFQQVLQIVLVADLICRRGDIMRSGMDTHKYLYLIKKDIVMRLEGRDSLSHLEAVVTIWNEK